MNTCIFCKIIAQEIPHHPVYEDGVTLAFLDIFPCVKGHTVVIPKVHAETLLDLENEATQAFFWGVKRTMERVKEILSPDGFTVGWNHGTAGGQAVPHLHVHILPRWENDGGGSIHSVIKNPGDMKVEEVAELFKK